MLQLHTIANYASRDGVTAVGNAWAGQESGKAILEFRQSAVCEDR